MMTRIPLYVADADSCGAPIERQCTEIQSFLDASCTSISAKTDDSFTKDDGGSSSSGSDCPSSMSSVSMASSSDDGNDEEDDEISVYSSGDDLMERISFLREKQQLLQRALSSMKQEEIYEANIAVGVAKHTHSSMTVSSLCHDAKETLLSMMQGSKHANPSSLKRALPLEEEHSSTTTQSSAASSAKRFKIDTESVSYLSASEACETVFDGLPSRPMESSFPFDDTTWMAKAFQNHFRKTSSNNKEWKVRKDPYLGNLAIPPCAESCQKEMQLQDALAFTSRPQVITSAVPPFAVVHANKAFTVLAGEQSVIGKPIESIFKVDASKETSGAFPTRIQLLNRDCQLCLTPIFERASNVDGISHILLQVRPSVEPATTVANLENHANSSSAFLRSTFVQSFENDNNENDNEHAGIGFVAVG
eukprot:scaffold504_cov109-Cylindrotheca_fusiformis.AAC.5